jgi:hypothetical protein
MEGDYHGHRWIMQLLWKEGIKPSDIHFSYLHFWKAPAYSSVFDWVQSFNSDKETARTGVREWHCNTPKEVFCEVIWKFPRRCPQ